MTRPETPECQHELLFWLLAGLLEQNGGEVTIGARALVRMPPMSKAIIRHEVAPGSHGERNIRLTLSRELSPRGQGSAIEGRT